MIRLIVFDLGETLVHYKGVLLDWSGHYAAALKHAFNKTGITYNDKIIEAASLVLLRYNTRVNPREIEVSAINIFGEILRLTDSNDETQQEFIQRFFEYFQRESEIESTASQLLQYARINGIKTAVLTDVPYGMPKELIRKDLSLLENYFDLILTSEDIGFRKPSTKGLEYILDHFQVNKIEVLSIGNEKKDIEMANKLGVYSVNISKGLEIPNWGQQKTITKLIEITDLLN